MWRQIGQTSTYYRNIFYLGKTWVEFRDFAYGWRNLGKWAVVYSSGGSNKYTEMWTRSTI